MSQSFVQSCMSPYLNVCRPVGYQPQPIGPAASHMGSALNHMTAEQQMRMSLASGWHPSMVHKRALQLAFSGLVV